MLQQEDVKNLANRLFENLDKLNCIIREKEYQYNTIEKKIADELKLVDVILSEKAELETILDRCKIDICKYRLAFQEIKNKYNDKLDKLISEKEFHFFLCFRKDYNKNVITAHQEVIDKKGYCWLAKFFKKRNKGGSYYSLEPFGESINIEGNSHIASALKSKIRERLNSGRPLYLFFYNPNPPDIQLYVCNIIDFYIGAEQIPASDASESKTPHCAYFPQYYFHKRTGSCASCKGQNTNKCKLEFLSNFYFKIDKIRKLESVSTEFVNLINCFTDDNINFAIPIFYPLLVTQKIAKEYFIENVQLEENKSEMVFKFSEREKGHAKTEKIHNFFSNLNIACNNCFVKVESGRCHKPHGPHPALHKTEKNDEILVCLPPEYRGDGSAMMFTVTLPEGTSILQKAKIEEKINDYINQLFRTNRGNYKFDQNSFLNKPTCDLT